MLQKAKKIIYKSSFLTKVNYEFRVCVCVCVREREREAKTLTEIQNLKMNLSDN